MVSKSGIVAIAAVAGLGWLCREPVKSEDLSAEPEAPHEQGAGGLGVDLFGLSFHANRNAGYNEINPGIGLRGAFWRPAPDWGLFGDTGIYYDSRRHWAKYVALGASYRLSESWNVGAAVAYGQSQTYHRGTPFVAPVPGVGFEYHGVTFNTVLLPSETATAKVAGLAFFVTIPIADRAH